MKTLRQICVATILSLTLSVSVLAGHIGTTGVAAPPPPPPDSATSTVTSILITMLGVIYR